jgi:hypothetical protein
MEILISYLLVSSTFKKKITLPSGESRPWYSISSSAGMLRFIFSFIWSRRVSYTPIHEDLGAWAPHHRCPQNVQSLCICLSVPGTTQMESCMGYFYRRS